MKEILILMAEYNKTANLKLYDILEKEGSSFLTKETGSYFDTLLGLLNHILVSDLGWLTAYRDSNLELPALKSPVLDLTHPGWKKNLYDNLTELKSHREACDRLLVDFINDTPAEIFEGTIEVARRGKSKSRTFPFGKLVMHLLNHQTHHRGAISQILDQNEIDNDFSNVLWLLTE